MQQTVKHRVIKLDREKTGVLSKEDSALVSSYVLGNLRYVPEQNYRVFVDFYDLSNNLLGTYVDLSEYRVTGVSQDGKVGQIEVDPVTDAEKVGYTDNVVLDYQVYSADIYDLFIHEISPSRTEVRCKSVLRTTEELQKVVQTLQLRLAQPVFTETFLTVTGKEKRLITNVTSEKLQGDQVVTFKLYEPLSQEVLEKDKVTIYEKIGEGKRFQIEEIPVPQKKTYKTVKGPNFDPISTGLEGKGTAVTEYLTAKELLSYSGNNNRIQNIFKNLNGKTAGVEVDYEDFSSFIHFSSAYERICNFDYKLSVIEEYEKKALETKQAFEVQRLEALIQGVKDGFDHYDNYLYYGDGPMSAPKDKTRGKPYRPLQRSSVEYKEWFDRILDAAEAFDGTNTNALIGAIPLAMRDDVATLRDSKGNEYSNEPLVIFVHMLGHHFDNEWIYAKALADRYKADNRLDFGIPKSLVREALEGFGLQLEEADRDLQEIFKACGLDGSFNKGKELSVETFKRMTEGLDYQPMGQEDYVREVYKRIYHNIPFLLKTKGTSRCIRTLVNCFGIPEDILSLTIRGGVSLDTPVFFGPEESVSSSLGKVRISTEQRSVPVSFENNRVVSGSVVSGEVSIQSASRHYTNDSHEVEFGFNLNKEVNSAIQQGIEEFDIDDIIGDPRNVSENYADDFKDLRQKVLQGLNFRQPSAIIRLARYIDSTLFRILKNFLPARAAVASGVIIEDNILHRSRYKGVEVDVKPDQLQIRYTVETGSSGSADTQSVQTGSRLLKDPVLTSMQGEIEVIEVTGSSPGAFDLIPTDPMWTVDYKQTVTTGKGIYEKDVTGSIVKYTGELSGSQLQVEDWWLTRKNPFHKQTQPVEQYTVNFFYEGLPSPAFCLVDFRPTYEGDYYKVHFGKESGRQGYVELTGRTRDGILEGPCEGLRGCLVNYYASESLNLIAISQSTSQSVEAFIGWVNVTDTGSFNIDVDTISRNKEYVTPSSVVSVFQDSKVNWVPVYSTVQGRIRLMLRVQEFQDVYGDHAIENLDGYYGNGRRLVIHWKVVGGEDPIIPFVGGIKVWFKVQDGSKYWIVITDDRVFGTKEGNVNVFGTPEDWEWVEDEGYYRPKQGGIEIDPNYVEGTVVEYGVDSAMVSWNASTGTWSPGFRGPFKTQIKDNTTKGVIFDADWWDTRYGLWSGSQYDKVLQYPVGWKYTDRTGSDWKRE